MIVPLSYMEIKHNQIQLLIHFPCLADIFRLISGYNHRREDIALRLFKLTYSLNNNTAFLCVLSDLCGESKLSL